MLHVFNECAKNICVSLTEARFLRGAVQDVCVFDLSCNVPSHIQQFCDVMLRVRVQG